MKAIKLAIFFMAAPIYLLAAFKLDLVDQVLNHSNKPCLVNSVDFHPKLNQFCVSYTHYNQVTVYEMEKDQIKVVQVLENPTSDLSCPQHTVFSSDGEKLITANWMNQTFNIYKKNDEGFFNDSPIAVISYTSDLGEGDFRPHGIASAGDYLAAAYGASKLHSKGVALYCMENTKGGSVSLKLLSFLEAENLPGIPKGIAFSPDRSSLIITLSETNSLAVYKINLEEKTLDSFPSQIIRGEATLLSRPEDVKFTADGRILAVSNSDKDTVTFYRYDKKGNRIKSKPIEILSSPQLCFPHGLAFSSDGNYLAITQFGPVVFDEDSNLTSWGDERKEAVFIYRLTLPPWQNGHGKNIGGGP